MDTSRIIRRIVRRCGTTNPFQICKAYHIIVKILPLGSTYGFHTYFLHQHYICINQDLDEDWQRFTCAHELGHIFLHEKENTTWLQRYTAFSIDKIEHQADTFAVALLSYGLEREEGMTIYDAAKLCGIPQAYAHRIRVQ